MKNAFTEVRGPAIKRPGVKFLASFDGPCALKLERKGDQVRVKRNGKTIAGIGQNGHVIRTAKP